MANSQNPSNRPSIVLVHGAFADASGWGRLITLLEAKGYPVIAVQNPLTSLAEDVATTRRIIDAQNGPVILVGHSYGGAVITAASAGNAKVKALVYVAAFAPDAGETLGALLGRGTPSDIGPALVTDSGGFVSIDRAKFHDVFCKDVAPAEARIMAATQKPIAGPSFGTNLPGIGWKNLASFYLVATEDHAIHPELQRFMSKRMGARVTEVKGSHVVFMSQPEATAKIVEEAANSISQQELAGAL